MIYLDHNATTPILPVVSEGMMPFLREEWGNPSSSYGFGARLKSQVELARSQVAELIGARYASEIIFTSGGTEANNTAIHSAILAQPQKRHIVTSVVEHSSVLSYCRFLEKSYGFQVTYLPVDSEGMLSLLDLENAVSDKTALVSLMWANNETGVMFPIEQAASICDERQIPFHCDAVQVAGKLPMNLVDTPCSYVSVSAHKIGGTKGIGALYVRENAPFTPLLHGGHQEEGRRGGTENVPGVVGFGIAAGHALANIQTFGDRVTTLRVKFEEEILNAIHGAEINGGSSPRLPNTTNIHIPGCDGDAVVTYLDQRGFCVSSGSACMESAITPSHVILAMSGSHERANESIRISIGADTTAEELRQLVGALKDFVAVSA